MDPTIKKFLGTSPVKPREKTIEQYLRKRIMEKGGLCWKFTSPGKRGVPDRICKFPAGCFFFVEVKAPGKELTEQQKLTISELTEKNATVFVVSSKEDVEKLIEGSL